MNSPISMIINKWKKTEQYEGKKKHKIEQLEQEINKKIRKDGIYESEIWYHKTGLYKKNSNKIDKYNKTTFEIQSDIKYLTSLRFNKIKFSTRSSYTYKSGIVNAYMKAPIELWPHYKKKISGYSNDCNEIGVYIDKYIEIKNTQTLVIPLLIPYTPMELCVRNAFFGLLTINNSDYKFELSDDLLTNSIQYYDFKPNDDYNVDIKNGLIMQNIIVEYNGENKGYYHKFLKKTTPLQKLLIDFGIKLLVYNLDSFKYKTDVQFIFQ